MNVDIPKLIQARTYLVENKNALIGLGFNIKQFRNSDDEHNPICNSVGCMIDYITVIDAKNVEENYTDEDGTIRFKCWSCDYFGIEDGNLDLWSFLFSSDWAYFGVKETKSLNQTIARIDYVIENSQAPTYWDYNIPMSIQRR